MDGRSNKTWQERVALVEHYKAIGWLDHYLDEPEDGIDGYPWAYAEVSDRGSSARYDVSTDVRITATHPCGLTFRWFIYIETGWTQERNWSRVRYDVAGVQKVLTLLSPRAAAGLRSVLLQHEVVARQQALEMSNAVTTLRAAADELHAMGLPVEAQ